MTRARKITEPNIVAFAQQRQVVLSRTGKLLAADRATVPFVEQHDALPETAALLMTTIEELKVAEEELVQQNEELLQTRESVESTSRHYKELFDLAPVGFIVTDLWGSIHEVNPLAAEMLRRDQSALVGKPLTVFVPLDDREEFRTRVTRLATLDGVHEWRAHLTPRGDVPLPVTLTTRVARHETREDSRILWTMRPAAVSAPTSFHAAAKLPSSLHLDARVAGEVRADQ